MCCLCDDVIAVLTHCEAPPPPVRLTADESAACVAKGDVSPEIRKKGRKKGRFGRGLAHVPAHASHRAQGKWLSTQEHDVITPELAISKEARGGEVV